MNLRIHLLLPAALLIAASFTCLGSHAQTRLNPHDEAARLIDALELSNAQRNAARDYLVMNMARGADPRAALQAWVQAQRGRGVAIRCRSGTTSECIAGR